MYHQSYPFSKTSGTTLWLQFKNFLAPKLDKNEPTHSIDGVKHDYYTHINPNITL
jgi:hypothetical protein